MAFATTNIQSGSVGSLKFYAGDWSGSIGDASGSLTLAGGRVYLCSFENQDSDGTKQGFQPEVSVSSGTITVTVGNTGNVTSGRFLIIYS